MSLSTKQLIHRNSRPADKGDYVDFFGVHFRAADIRSYSSGKPSRPLAAFEQAAKGPGYIVSASALRKEALNRPRNWGKGRSVAAQRRRAKRYIYVYSVGRCCLARDAAGRLALG